MKKMLAAALSALLVLATFATLPLAAQQSKIPSPASILGFEPGAGKGPVARATLYFLLRYPGVVGDPGHELTPGRLPILLDWHEEDPVSDYERHRNFVIHQLQGNRNPMIDHPDWAGRIDFAKAWVQAPGQI